MEHATTLSKMHSLLFKKSLILHANLSETMQRIKERTRRIQFHFHNMYTGTAFSTLIIFNIQGHNYNSQAILKHEQAKILCFYLFLRKNEEVKSFIRT